MKSPQIDLKPNSQSGDFMVRAKISLAGLVAGLRWDRSIRELWLVLICSWIAMCVARPEAVWWALVILAGSISVSLEYLNAALEASLDKLHPDRHPAIGLAKDLASAAAFVANITALCVLGFALTSV